MTWVLGWPITDDFILEFSRKHNLLPGIKHDVENRLQSATLAYIVRATGCRALCCWVDGTTELVFELTSYDGPRSKPPKWVDPSELPPREATARLARLLGVHHKPHWWLYDDGSLASWEANPYRHLEEYQEESSSDEEVSDEEWDSDGDATEVGYSDNGAEEDESSGDGHDSQGEAEVSHIHEDAADDKSMSPLRAIFDAQCSI